MPHYGRTSRNRLSTCTPNIQKVFNEVIKHIDCTIIEGHRSEAEQDRLFTIGFSKVRWPNSKHNPEISEAVDSVPYINGKASWDKEQCLFFGGYVMCIASQMGVKLRWGGCWSGDLGDIGNQEFDDLAHFEEL